MKTDRRAFITGASALSVSTLILPRPGHAASNVVYRNSNFVLLREMPERIQDVPGFFDVQVPSRGTVTFDFQLGMTPDKGTTAGVFTLEKGPLKVKGTHLVPVRGKGHIMVAPNKGTSSRLSFWFNTPRKKPTVAPKNFLALQFYQEVDDKTIRFHAYGARGPSRTGHVNALVPKGYYTLLIHSGAPSPNYARAQDYNTYLYYRSLKGKRFVRFDRGRYIGFDH